MKKLLILFVALLFVGAVAFADVTLHATVTTIDSLDWFEFNLDDPGSALTSLDLSDPTNAGTNAWEKTFNIEFTDSRVNLLIFVDDSLAENGGNADNIWITIEAGDYSGRFLGSKTFHHDADTNDRIFITGYLETNRFLKFGNYIRVTVKWDAADTNTKLPTVAILPIKFAF